MKWTNLFARLFKQNTEYKILAIIFAVILILGYILKGNAVNIPVICNIFSYNHNGDLEKYDNYLEVVGKSKECNGITVTLESAVADKNILMLSFFVKNENEEINNLIDADIHISSLTINGKEKYLISKNNLELINDNEARIVKRISWNYDNLPKNLNICVGIEEMFKNKGDWDIKFNVDTAKILKDTYEEKVNNNINLRDLKGTIREVTISPLTIKIDTVYKTYNKSRIGFLVLNENDDELIMIGENTSYNINQYEYVAKYVSNEPLERLKIIPIYYGNSNNEEILTSNKINLEEFHQFYLNISDNLAIKIEDYIRDGDYIILKYNYEYMGKVISADLNTLYLKSDNIVYEEKNNEEIDNLKRKYFSDDYKIAAFKSTTNENVEIGCYDGSNVQLLEEYAFDIEKSKE